MKKSLRKTKIIMKIIINIWIKSHLMHCAQNKLIFEITEFRPDNLTILILKKKHFNM